MQPVPNIERRPPTPQPPNGWFDRREEAAARGSRQPPGPPPNAKPPPHNVLFSTHRRPGHSQHRRVPPKQQLVYATQRRDGTSVSAAVQALSTGSLNLDEGRRAMQRSTSASSGGLVPPPKAQLLRPRSAGPSATLLRTAPPAPHGTASHQPAPHALRLEMYESFKPRHRVAPAAPALAAAHHAPESRSAFALARSAATPSAQLILGLLERPYGTKQRPAPAASLSVALAASAASLHDGSSEGDEEAAAAVAAAAAAAAAADGGGHFATVLQYAHRPVACKRAMSKEERLYFLRHGVTPPRLHKYEKPLLSRADADAFEASRKELMLGKVWLPLIHTSHSHLPFTPLIHTSPSHLPFTPPLHTSPSHLSFTPPLHTSPLAFTAHPPPSLSFTGAAQAGRRRGASARGASTTFHWPPTGLPLTSHRPPTDRPPTFDQVPWPSSAAEGREATARLLLDPIAAAAMRERLARALHRVRLASLDVVEALNEWRRRLRSREGYYASLPAEEISCFHEGKDYIITMETDLSFLPAPSSGEPRPLEPSTAFHQASP